MATVLLEGMADMSTVLFPWMCYNLPPPRTVIVANPGPLGGPLGPLGGQLGDYRGAATCSGIPAPHHLVNWTLPPTAPPPPGMATTPSSAAGAPPPRPASPAPPPPPPATPPSTPSRVSGAVAAKSSKASPVRRTSPTVSPRRISVSALVSRLHCSSSGSDVGSQGSPEAEGCLPEEQRQEKNYPWFSSFSQQCRAAIGSRSSKQLDDLLAVYLEHVTPHYRDCHKLPNKAAKLKRNINETMIFFHMLYMDIREPLESAFYYDKMTELMAMYLDLEITASRRGKDTEKAVTNKLSTSLYTFLDHSEDHILDALLKTKLINKHSKKISVPLLRKILSDLVVRRPLAELTYVRFLLSFKLWKNVVEDAEERRAINKLAGERLHPPPEYFLDHEIAKPNAEVLPKLPKSKKNCTLFYLGAKFSVRDASRAFFRYCKDTCRSNVYRRNFNGSEDVDKSFLLSSQTTSDKVEEHGTCSPLMNDIWSIISNSECCTKLLGESSDIFSNVQEEVKKDETEQDSLKRKRLQPDSPDSRIDLSDKIRKKDNRKKKETSVPDPKLVMPKTEGGMDTTSASSPAKGVQDCCLGSVFMEQVNKVGGGQSHIKNDPCETELPTSSRQHSVLESLVYAQPGSDNEAVASSSVSPDAGSVPTSHLDTNECDSSVEILQSRQVPTDVGLPIDLKPALNIEEELRSSKPSKEDLLLFGEGGSVADDGGGFDNPFSEFGMFRLNDDIFNCRTFEGMDQPIMYRRGDVPGTLPFQGSPLLEEDEDDLSSRFKWSSVADYQTSVQSTIINQSSGTASSADFPSCYPGMETKNLTDVNEEPKLGDTLKTGKGATQGTLWQMVMSGGKLYRVPASIFARYKAAHLSQLQSQSVSQPVSQPLLNSAPLPTMSDPACRNNAMLEGSDNLKILAEEAVRVRDASVAEAKCKSKLAANFNLPLKKRKSLPSVSDIAYPCSPMLSIAQIQNVNKSVIVMNSQYNASSNQPKDTKCTQNVNSGDTNMPIDMSTIKTSVNHGTSETKSCMFCCRMNCFGTCQKGGASSNGFSMNLCKSGYCASDCKCGNRSVPPQWQKTNGCQNAACNGKCYLCGNQATQDKFQKSERSVKDQKPLNGILKTRLVGGGSKCFECKSPNCDGYCKRRSSSSMEGSKTPKVTFQDTSSKSVLKCIQCKSLGCNGKCMTNQPRCSTSSSLLRKSSRCALCKLTACDGTCKNPGKRCALCLIASCEGTCYLSGRSTNNSLSAVNDFSILNSAAFTNKQTKCHMCKNTCCGKCKNATGYKHCPYCCTEEFSVNTSNHSIRSILGASSKSKYDEAHMKRAKAPSSNRRTRSSTSSKHSSPAASSESLTYSVEDAKRRKKSLLKPASR